MIAANAPELVEYTGDSAVLRKTCAQFPSGVAALSAVVDGESIVLVASSFQVGISLDPPLVLFAVQHTSTSWPKLRSRPRIGVSILGETHDAAAVKLASRAAREDRFSGLDTVTTESGAHFIAGAPVWLECSVFSHTPAGDHDVVLLRVHALGSIPDQDPLVWHNSGFRPLGPRAAAR